MQSRTNSSWSVYVITNIKWVVVRTNYVLGAGRELPNYVKKKKCIISLNVNSIYGGGGVIEDNLCAFRCLAYHRTQNRKGIERLTLRYYREYLGHSIPKNAKFKGFSLEEIPQFENIFDIKSIYFNCSRMKHAFTFIGHAECIKIP